MHGPVPQWHEKVGHSVNKYELPFLPRNSLPPSKRTETNSSHRFMDRLTPLSPMERSNYFVQTTCPNEDLSSILFCPNGLSVENFHPSPPEIIIRRERQTFRRLPRTDAIVFSVKTTLTALDELPSQELANLATEISHWPDDVAKYKGRDVWGPAVLEFCKQRAGPQHEDA